LKFGLADESRIILCDDLPLSENEPAITEEVVTYRFVIGTMIWLDITSSVMVGTAPRLLPYHFSVITSNSQTKLDSIMGCKNWVMLQIGRIAALHERRTQNLQEGHITCSEFEKVVYDIGKEIQCGLTQEAFEGMTIAERDSATLCNAMSCPSSLVTHFFAYMASIYLHLVIQGFRNLEELNMTISGAMEMLETHISVQLLPALVFPLFIIGCVARQEDEQVFRMYFSSPPLLDPSLKHRGRILPILEEIWNRRRTTTGYTWEYSLELSHDLLLI
jgi:C6 transcription factor Pro1